MALQSYKVSTENFQEFSPVFEQYPLTLFIHKNHPSMCVQVKLHNFAMQLSSSGFDRSYFQQIDDLM